MNLEPIKVVLLVVALFSLVAMINHAKAHEQKNGRRTSIYYNPLMALDYIRITRAERGNIGIWFWTFLASAILVIAVVAIEIATGR
jgi:hypothetical protein